jgi:hypothetical protein
MLRSKPRKRVRGQLLMMGEIPINRPYAYDKPFFKESGRVFQGILFPLKRQSFKQHKIKLGKSARIFGVSGRGLDVRNISYPG